MVETILAEMKRRRIAKTRMADALGIWPQTFCDKAKGKTDFTASEIEKMCMILGLEIKIQKIEKEY